MALSILICEPDYELAQGLQSFLEEKSFVVETAADGKDCQLKMYKGKFFAVVLDIETQNHSGLQVLRYLRLSAPSVKVILTATEEKLKEFDLSNSDLAKLGTSDILIKPYKFEELKESIEGEHHFLPNTATKESSDESMEEEVNGDDDDFTHVKVEDFYSGNTTIFDCYIRLAPGKYMKIAQKGEFFERSRIDKIVEEKGIESFYFKTEDRGNYINFINRVLKKVISSTKGKDHEKIRTVKNLAEKYIEETYTEGLKPQLLEEGKKICQNMFDMIQKDVDLSSLLASYEEKGENIHGHLFLTSFMAVIICKNLDWTSTWIVELAAFGGLLHDIGMLKLPEEIRNKDPKHLTPEQMTQFKDHPRLGAELLQEYPLVTEPVRQIVYQHHENINGSGFPHGLSGIKIYPPAKVVALGNSFANFLVSQKISPIKGLGPFISDRKNIEKFDPIILKALVKGFLKDQTPPLLG
ncbi:MAG: response regulator [Bacteriovoracales bacterium]|nr:response regulator [Bacteriovoracales bacterium]